MTGAFKIPVVLPKHRNIGLVSAVVFVSLVIVYLHWASYEVPDPKPEVYVTKGIAEIDNVQIETLKAEPDAGGSEGGSPMDGPVNNVPPTPQVIATPSSTTGRTKVPKGTGTVTNKPSDKPAPKPTNPFAKPGSNGNGRGNGFGNETGNGTGIGSGNDGGGTGNGTGNGAKQRGKTSTPNDSDIESDENCKVVFNIVYNASGNVISAQPIIGSCTTTNNNIIAQAKQAIMRGLKYEVLEGAPDIKVRYTLTISAK